MNKDKFMIEDAFESDEDEKIRVYGSTKQTPVKGPKSREKTNSTSDEIPLTECQVNPRLYVGDNFIVFVKKKTPKNVKQIKY